MAGEAEEKAKKEAEEKAKKEAEEKAKKVAMEKAKNELDQKAKKAEVRSTLVSFETNMPIIQSRNACSKKSIFFFFLMPQQVSDDKLHSRIAKFHSGTEFERSLATSA